MLLCRPSDLGASLSTRRWMRWYRLPSLVTASWWGGSTDGMELLLHGWMGPLAAGCRHSRRWPGSRGSVQVHTPGSPARTPPPTLGTVLICTHRVSLET